MHPDYLDILNRRFELKEVEGPSKLMPLPDAIGRFVKPGMTLHFGVSHCRPNGIGDEVARQFIDGITRGKFHILPSGAGMPWRLQRYAPRLVRAFLDRDLKKARRRIGKT